MRSVSNAIARTSSRPDVRVGVVDPAHRTSLTCSPSRRADHEELDVEGEAVDALQLEQPPRRRQPKQLEPALGVAPRQPRDQTGSSG